MKIVNARIWTGDPARPWAEALAVRGDRSPASGAPRRRRARGRRAPSTRRPAGRPRLHRLARAFPRRRPAARLGRSSTCASREEFVEAIRALREAGAGGHVDHGRRLGSRELGRSAARRRDGSTRSRPTPGLGQSARRPHGARQHGGPSGCGVTSQTRDVDGGTIVRGAQRRADGPAQGQRDAPRRSRHVPAPSAEALDRALDAAMRYVAERGVTSVHHMGTWDDLDVFERAAKYARPHARASMQPCRSRRGSGCETVKARRFGGDDGSRRRLARIGALKGFVDGSLGSHTAAFFDPFTRRAPRPRALRQYLARDRCSAGSRAPMAPASTSPCTPSAIAPIMSC